MKLRLEAFRLCTILAVVEEQPPTAFVVALADVSAVRCSDFREMTAEASI